MSIDAMKAVLDFLEQGNFVYPTKIADDLRAAITEAERQEPVAHLYRDQYGKLKLSQTLPHEDGAFAVFTTPQPAIPEWRPTNEELTAIYMKANGIEGKNPPITTERIFTAMRAMLAAAPKPEGQ